MTEFFYRELSSLAFGDLLGEGSARKVYELRLNPDYVIKLEQNARSFQNVAEWEIWQWVKDHKMNKWFAPCHMISNCGAFLVQRRVLPARPHELPKKLPFFLCDLKPENFGIFDGRFVAADYGTVGSIIRHAPMRSVAAEWRLDD